MLIKEGRIKAARNLTSRTERGSKSCGAAANIKGDDKLKAGAE